MLSETGVSCPAICSKIDTSVVNCRENSVDRGELFELAGFGGELIGILEECAGLCGLGQGVQVSAPRHCGRADKRMRKEPP